MRLNAMHKFGLKFIATIPVHSPFQIIFIRAAKKRKIIPTRRKTYGNACYTVISWLQQIFDCFLYNNWTRYFVFVSLGKRRPRTTQSMPSFRHSRRQDMKRVASAPVVVNSYRNQVKAGIVRAMLPRTESSNLRSAFGAAETWRSKLLTSRPTLEKRLSEKNS